MLASFHMLCDAAYPNGSLSDISYATLEVRRKLQLLRAPCILHELQ